MTPSRSSPAPEGDFDAFLFATVGEEREGMALSVLSALSRLDIDPWADAERLAGLPKDAAIAALGATIARLPPGNWQRKDATAIAARLVELLPAQRGKRQPARTMELPRGRAKPSRTALVVLGGVTLGLAAYLLLGQVTGIEHRAAHDSAYMQTVRPPAR